MRNYWLNILFLNEWGTAGGWQQSTENLPPFWLLGLRVYMTFVIILLELLLSTVD